MELPEASACCTTKFDPTKYNRLQVPLRVSLWVMLGAFFFVSSVRLLLGFLDPVLHSPPNADAQRCEDYITCEFTYGSSEVASKCNTQYLLVHVSSFPM